jgi:hypothetical protein
MNADPTMQVIGDFGQIAAFPGLQSEAQQAPSLAVEDDDRCRPAPVIDDADLLPANDNLFVARMARPSVDSRASAII